MKKKYLLSVLGIASITFPSLITISCSGNGDTIEGEIKNAKGFFKDDYVYIQIEGANLSSNINNYKIFANNVKLDISKWEQINYTQTEMILRSQFKESLLNQEIKIGTKNNNESNYLNIGKYPSKENPNPTPPKTPISAKESINKNIVNLNGYVKSNLEKINAQWIFENKTNLLDGDLVNLKNSKQIKNVIATNENDLSTSMKITFNIDAGVSFEQNGELSNNEKSITIIISNFDNPPQLINIDNIYYFPDKNRIQLYLNGDNLLTEKDNFIIETQTLPSETNSSGITRLSEELFNYEFDEKTNRCSIKLSLYGDTGSKFDWGKENNLIRIWLKGYEDKKLETHVSYRPVLNKFTSDIKSYSLKTIIDGKLIKLKPSQINNINILPKYEKELIGYAIQYALSDCSNKKFNGALPLGYSNFEQLLNACKIKFDKINNTSIKVLLEIPDLVNKNELRLGDPNITIENLNDDDISILNANVLEQNVDNQNIYIIEINGTNLPNSKDKYSLKLSKSQKDITEFEILENSSKAKIKLKFKLLDKDNWGLNKVDISLSNFPDSKQIVEVHYRSDLSFFIRQIQESNPQETIVDGNSLNQKPSELVNNPNEEAINLVKSKIENALKITLKNKFDNFMPLGYETFDQLFNDITIKFIKMNNNSVKVSLEFKNNNNKGNPNILINNLQNDEIF